MNPRVQLSWNSPHGAVLETYRHLAWQFLHCHFTSHLTRCLSLCTPFSERLKSSIIALWRMTVGQPRSCYVSMLVIPFHLASASRGGPVFVPIAVMTPPQHDILSGVYPYGDLDRSSINCRVSRPTMDFVENVLSPFQQFAMMEPSKASAT